MKFNAKPGLAALGVTGVLALGVLGAGAVMAQESDETPSTDQAPMESDRRHRAGKAGAGALFKASGLDRSVFIEGFESGLTVGEVLEQQGLDPQAVIADALVLIDERLANAVADGHLDQATADEKLASAEAMLTALLDMTPQPHEGRGPGRGDGPGPGGRFGGGSAAEALGLTPAELREELSDGDTIADVAEALGIDVQTVIDAMLAPIFEKIDGAETNGRITADEAVEKKADATEHITDIVNNGFPERPMRDSVPGDDDTDASFEAVA